MDPASEAAGHTVYRQEADRQTDRSSAHLPLHRPGLQPWDSAIPTLTPPGMSQPLSAKPFWKCPQRYAQSCLPVNSKPSQANSEDGPSHSFYFFFNFYIDVCLHACMYIFMHLFTVFLFWDRFSLHSLAALRFTM